MLEQINGLHHVTSIGSDPVAIDRFWTDRLGLRRVKKTVNFDAPEVYHLYYGDDLGRPSTAMTYFPFPGARRGTRGSGEVGDVRLTIPTGSATFWADRLGATVETAAFGDTVVRTEGPDGDAFTLIEAEDARTPFTGTIASDNAIRGFHSVSQVLRDTGPTAELLTFMGYEATGTEGDTTRFTRPGGTANVIDLVHAPNASRADQAAGSVHHIAYSVDNRARQLEVREALVDQGFDVTPVIDRDYFWAIYFRSPGGVLFEVATNEPGFDRDEDAAHLGEALKLPAQHEHLRDRLENHLVQLD